MSFIAQEQSQADGRPVELFLFKTALQSVGTGFTNSEDAITFGNETYQPIGVTRDEASYSEESDASAVTLRMPADNEFARQFIIIPPGDRYVVTVYRRHITDAGLETVVWWKGYISQVSYRDSTAYIRCKSLLELFTRLGPRMTVQQPCNHVLYDSRCAVAENTFRYQGFASVAADGISLTFTGISSSAPLTDADAGFQAAYYVGGFIRTPDNVDYRLIVGQSGDVLTIQFPFFETVAGLQLDVFAGCDHQITTCDEKFTNILNHGGNPYVPGRNIYTKGVDSTNVATSGTTTPLT